MGSEISKKDITRLGFRSSLLQASFNYESCLLYTSPSPRDTR